MDGVVEIGPPDKPSHRPAPIGILSLAERISTPAKSQKYYYGANRGLASC
jgi:hypothetical protein